MAGLGAFIGGICRADRNPRESGGSRHQFRLRDFRENHCCPAGSGGHSRRDGSVSAAGFRSRAKLSVSRPFGAGDGRVLGVLLSCAEAFDPAQRLVLGRGKAERELQQLRIALEVLVATEEFPGFPFGSF